MKYLLLLTLATPSGLAAQTIVNGPDGATVVITTTQGDTTLIYPGDGTVSTVTSETVEGSDE